VPDLVLEAHRRRIPIDHPLRSVTRLHLQYPTENVEFTYLEAIGKTKALLVAGDGGFMVTNDNFSDKAVRSVCGGYNSILWGRLQDERNFYAQALAAQFEGEDHFIAVVVDYMGKSLAVEAVDIHGNFHFIMFSISGSTLKGFRDNLETPKLSATDTTFASGKFGFGVAYIDASYTGRIHYNPMLLPPSSKVPEAVYIIESEIEGKGKQDDPIRPKLLRNLVEINKLDNIPEFLK